MSHNRGVHAHRLAANPEERRFARMWAEQDLHYNTLAYLLGDGKEPVQPTKEQRVAVATFAQWLGSPVGQAFLVMLGYEKRENYHG
jgi:hypothetical protein